MFEISNYHSRKAVLKALANGAKIKIKARPLTKKQLQENAEAARQGKEAPHVIYTPLPRTPIEIFCASNKQVPIWSAVVVLDDDLNIISITGGTDYGSTTIPS